MSFLVLSAEVLVFYFKFFEFKGIDYKTLSREEFDISHFGSVISVIKDYQPDVILNCAAYNLVDQAEEDFSQAFAVNTIGPYNLALAAKNTNTFLIHFSTDYVFDGEKGDFYTEADKPSPINKYGLSKLLGELAISKVGKSYLIFRVSWLFGEGRQNFLTKVLNWAEKSEIPRIAYCNLPAKRPFFSALDSSKLEKALNIKLPHWMEVVSSFAKKI